MKQEDNNKKISFIEEFADLIREDVPKIQLPVEFPDKYRRPFIHTENGFVKKYCLYEEEETKLRRIRKK